MRCRVTEVKKRRPWVERQEGSRDSRKRLLPPAENRKRKIPLRVVPRLARKALLPHGFSRVVRGMVRGVEGSERGGCTVCALRVPLTEPESLCQVPPYPQPPCPPPSHNTPPAVVGFSLSSQRREDVDRVRDVEWGGRVSGFH